MIKIFVVSAAILALSACSDTNETTPQSQPQEDNAAPAELNGPPPPPEDVPPEATAETAAPEEIEGITNRRLSFAPGTSSARIEGAITGYETIDYLLGVRAGQAMNISMASSNTAAYFNLLEPGETEVAIFNGSMGDNMFEGVAQKSGDYRIRVYLYRNAARRNEKASYTLEAAVN